MKREITPNACESCNRKSWQLYRDHDIEKWVCNTCWKKTHNTENVKKNWNTLGIAH